MFSDFWINKEEAYPKWWIGLYDSKLTKLYSWIDGNIMRFSAFADGHPSGDKDVQCGCDIPAYYAWFTVKCETMANVICKKPEGKKGIYSVFLLIYVVKEYSFENSILTTGEFGFFLDFSK